MPDTSYLGDPQAEPPLIGRYSLEEEPIATGHRVIVTDDGDGEIHLARSTAPPRGFPEEVRVRASDVDPLATVDFRVRYENGVVYINRGRVHCSLNPSPGRPQPVVFIIEADELPLVLSEGNETAEVVLSLPWIEYPFGSATGPADSEAEGPDGTVYTYQTYYSAFDQTEYNTRFARAVGQPKFAAVGPIIATPVAETDYTIHLATVGHSLGVRQHHIGSVFLHNGYDGNFFLS